MRLDDVKYLSTFFLQFHSNQVVDINLGGKLTVARNLIIRHTNTHNLILKSTSGGLNLVISGDLTIQSNANLILTNGGATFSTSGLNVDITGSFYQAGGNFTLNTGTITSTALSPTGTVVFNVSGTFNLSAGLLKVCATAGTHATLANGTINVTGACNISGGTLDLCSSTTTGGGIGTLNLNGNFVHTAGIISRTAAAAGNTGTINLIGAGAQTIESTPGCTSGNTITFNIIQLGGTASIAAGKFFLVNPGTTFNLNNNTAATADLTVTGTLNVSGTMNVKTSAILDMGISVMSNSTATTGNFILNSTSRLITKHADGISSSPALTGCIRVTGLRTLPSDANYTYNGTAAQVTGNGLPLTLTADLTISNTSAIGTNGVTLSQATTSTGTLTLTTGRLITATGALMTIGNGGIISPAGGSSSSYVDGPIRKKGFTSGSEYVFPTGDLAKWARIGFTPTATSATDEFTATYFPSNPHTTADATFADSTLDRPAVYNISWVEFWTLDRNLGTNTGKVKLYWESGTFSGITYLTPLNLRVVHFHNPGAGLKWYNEGLIPTFTGTAASGTVETDVNVTSFSPFTFGEFELVNPLPVELLSFTGYNVDSGNKLKWSTATEINNDRFELERSEDGIVFNKIASINGSGNSTSVKNYDHLDSSPLAGINYYRLKQIDFNGNHSYSNIIAIDRSTENTILIVYPNPSNDLVNIVTSSDITSIIIYNMLGEVVYDQSENLNNSYTYKPVSNGVYTIRATSSNGKISTNRFIKN